MSGEIPEWPKGTDCKSVDIVFESSNLSLPTIKAFNVIVKGFFYFISAFLIVIIWYNNSYPSQSNKFKIL